MTNECEGCAARDRMIQRLAERIDELEKENDNNKPDVEQVATVSAGS